MNRSQLGGHSAAGRMAERGYRRVSRAERGGQIVVCCQSVELCSGVSGSPSKRHVSAVFSQHYRIPSVLLDGLCPVHLPHREIGVPVKAEKNTGLSPRIADDETGEELTVRGPVAHPARLDRVSVKPRWLKENSLLRSPKKSQHGEQQREHNRCGNHMRALRGFQWVCMAGNLRQCEFR